MGDIVCRIRQGRDAEAMFTSFNKDHLRSPHPCYHPMPSRLSSPHWDSSCGGWGIVEILHLGQTIFRLLRKSLGNDSATLLREVGNVGGTSAAADEEKVAQHVRSQFPIDIVSIAENPESRRLGNLVAAYEELGLSDEASSRVAGGPLTVANRCRHIRDAFSARG